MRIALTHSSQCYAARWLRVTERVDARGERFHRGSPACFGLLLREAADLDAGNRRLSVISTRVQPKDHMSLAGRMPSHLHTSGAIYRPEPTMACLGEPAVGFVRAVVNSWLQRCARPKSASLQTGGLAVGDTSTRSSPASAAASSAASMGISPCFSPVSSIRSTRGTRISPLMRGPSFLTGGAAWGRLAMRLLLLQRRSGEPKRAPAAGKQSSSVASTRDSALPMHAHIAR